MRALPCVRAAAALLLPACALSAPAQTMTVHDQVEIASSPVGGVRPDELSGLAWDADEQLLYAISDKGRVFHFRLLLEGTRIRELTALHGAALTASDGTRARFNAEGLTLIDADNGKRGDTQLLVTIENGQRLMRFTPQGRALGDVALPPPLADPDNYRGGNNGLEAVTLHLRHPLLAPQRALRGTPAQQHTLYAADGKTWSFERAPGGEVKAIEALTGGALLVLERPGAGGARLRRVELGACAGAATPCPVADLLDPGALDAADNHEGLARLSDRLFLIVSDNGKDRARPTRLVLIGFVQR